MTNQTATEHEHEHEHEHWHFLAGADLRPGKHAHPHDHEGTGHHGTHKCAKCDAWVTAERHASLRPWCDACRAKHLEGPARLAPKPIAEQV